MAGNTVRFVATLNDQVSGGLSRIKDNFDRLGKSKGAATFLQGVGMGAGISAFNMLGNAVSAATDFMFDSIDAASNLREAMALNEQVFERNADAVDAWAKAGAEAFGMSEREALNAAAQFGNLFRGMGLGLDETSAKAEELTERAADLGSAFNASSEDVAQAIRSGLVGESEPLRRFGVMLDEQKVKAKALAMGYKEVGGRLSDTAKVAARYALIMEQSAGSAGMFGRDTGSLADSQKELAAELENVQAAIGNELVPIMLELSKVAKDTLVPALGGVVSVFHFLKNEGEGTIPVLAANTAEFQKLDGALAVATARYRAFVPPMEDAQQVAEDQADALKKLGARFSGTVGPANDLEGAEDDLRGTTKKTAAEFRDLARDAERASDAMLEAIYGPEQLRMELGLVEDELKANQRELRKLEAIKDPTKDQRQSMKELRLKVSEGREEVDKMRVRIGMLDNASLDEVTAAFKVFNSRGLKPARDTALALLNILRKITKFNPSSYMDPSYDDHRATGGPVLPGNTYTVGETGQERLVMYPGGGGLVIPGGGGGGAGGGSSAVVHTTINLDGRTIAEVVDRHLYYKAARAPQSAYAG